MTFRNGSNSQWSALTEKTLNQPSLARHVATSKVWPLRDGLRFLFCGLLLSGSSLVLAESVPTAPTAGLWYGHGHAKALKNTSKVTTTEYEYDTDFWFNVDDHGAIEGYAIMRCAIRLDDHKLRNLITWATKMSGALPSPNTVTKIEASELSQGGYARALPAPANLPALPAPATRPALPAPANLPALPAPAALPALPSPSRVIVAEPIPGKTAILPVPANLPALPAPATPPALPSPASVIVAEPIPGKTAILPAPANVPAVGPSGRMLASAMPVLLDSLGQLSSLIQVLFSPNVEGLRLDYDEKMPVVMAKIKGQVVQNQVTLYWETPPPSIPFTIRREDLQDDIKIDGGQARPINPWAKPAEIQFLPYGVSAVADGDNGELALYWDAMRMQGRRP